MSTISMLRYESGELTSADDASLSIENSAGATVVGPVTVAPTSAGTYTYDTTALTPGNYTAHWTFTTAGMPTAVVVRAFVIDSPVSLTSGATLMSIEQSLAGRLGGTYRRFAAQTGSTISTVKSTRMKTSIDIGDYEDLYILRRGVLYDGSRVDGFDSNDRVRMVSEYDHATGTLANDQEYAVAPVDTEMIELHYLDPEFELRPAVLDGLARCYFWDTVQIASTAPYGTINVSALIPWLTSPRQIHAVEAQMTGSQWPSTRLPWSLAYQSGTRVMLDSENTLPGTLSLTVLRPVSTLVNDVSSLSGPNDDWDILPVELEYAVRASHVAAWIRHPERLTPIAAQGLGIPLSMAAQAFSVRSLALTNFQPEYPQVRFGGMQGDIVLGNAPEAVV